MRNLFLAVIFLFTAILLNGCYDARGDLELKSDGSGNLAFTLDIEKDYYTTGGIKKSLDDAITHYNLSDEIKIVSYAEKEVKDKNMAQIDCYISFKDVNKLRYLELGVSVQRMPYASMSAQEKTKYPANSYKLHIEAENQGNDTISLIIRPADRVITSNGELKNNTVKYRFSGKATRDNYIILKPVTLNIFNLIFI